MGTSYMSVVILGETPIEPTSPFGKHFLGGFFVFKSS
jgi:hypothetical protein